MSALSTEWTPGRPCRDMSADAVTPAAGQPGQTGEHQGIEVALGERVTHALAGPTPPPSPVSVLPVRKDNALPSIDKLAISDSPCGFFEFN